MVGFGDPSRLSGERPKKPAKADLHVDLANFGPVSRGSIDLKPLTIFIGPNNSGKSYAAMLIHSILSSETRIRGPDIGSRTRHLHGLFDSNIQKIVRQNKGKSSFSIPAGLTGKMITATQNLFNETLESEIVRNFGSPARNLVQTKQKQAKITVSNSIQLDISIDQQLRVRTSFVPDIVYTFSISSAAPHVSERKRGRSVTVTINKKLADEFFAHDLTAYLVDSICDQITHANIPHASHYFPASRSGLLQGHGILSASMARGAPPAGIGSFHAPKLPGTMSDFVSNTIALHGRKEHFFKLAEQLESDLLPGHVQPASRGKFATPEIVCRSKQDEIPLHRASSAISEIAPFSLYLKHIVRPGSMLIIEEPEAHLHPASQLIFAKHMVKMIRSGLHVLIITHSVFLLEELGKFLLAGQLAPEIRGKELGLDRDCFLRPEDVSPYVFVKRGEDDHEIRPIETNDTDGISQEEFVRVSELLYSNSIELQNLLSRRG